MLAASPDVSAIQVCHTFEFVTGYVAYMLSAMTYIPEYCTQLDNITPSDQSYAYRVYRMIRNSSSMSVSFLLKDGVQALGDSSGLNFFVYWKLINQRFPGSYSEMGVGDFTKVSDVLLCMCNAVQAATTQVKMDRLVVLAKGEKALNLHNTYLKKMGVVDENGDPLSIDELDSIIKSKGEQWFFSSQDLMAKRPCVSTLCDHDLCEGYHSDSTHDDSDGESSSSSDNADKLPAIESSSDTDSDVKSCTCGDCQDSDIIVTRKPQMFNVENVKRVKVWVEADRCSKTKT